MNDLFITDVLSALNAVGYSISLDPSRRQEFNALLKSRQTQKLTVIDSLQECLIQEDPLALRTRCQELQNLVKTTFDSHPLQKVLLLTQSELVCLCLVARGHVNKTIAKILKISPRTIEIHISKCKSKLGYQNRHQLITWFWELITTLMHEANLNYV